VTLAPDSTSALFTGVLDLPGGPLDLSRHVAVMAIVNRTPDSFYDRGATFALDAAVTAGVAAVAAGAEIVDVGGVKFAPGPAVTVEEEIARVVPVVRELAPIARVSVDTFQPEVARAAIEAGAAIINDTTGLHDPAMADVIAQGGAGVVIAHSLAAPRTQHPLPRYEDVIGDIAGFLAARRELARERGVPDARIVLDPGHDLNKSTRQTLELTRRLGELAGLGAPLLVALSNKDFVGETLDRARGERLSGSLAAAVFCVLQGARIVRAHNVRETVDAMRMVEAILGWREPVLELHNARAEGNA